MRNPMDVLALRAVAWQADRLYRRFLAAADQAAAVQDRVLARKLALNADSDFGRVHHLDRIGNYQDFVANLPVTDYEHYRSYIDRVKRGEHRALLGSRQKLLMFALTSGTTAEAKFIPVTQQFLEDYRRGWLVFGIKLFGDHPQSILRPILQVTSAMDEFRSEGGTPCGAITGLMAATQKRLVRRHYVAPLCVAEITDSLAKYYTIMRLAIPRDVAVMITANPATHIRLAQVANEHREPLIRDIHDGTLTDQMDVPGNVRPQLRSRLKADPKTARRLTKLVETHGGLWPKDYWQLAFQANWTGGTMGLHLQHLPEYFGKLPVRDIGLMASEGRMSVPIEDGTPAGVLDFQSSFFEFIPVDQIDADSPDVLRCHELEIGAEYYILLTTSSGLYRYDIRDVVRVVGYQGQAPVIEFLNKGAHVSSMTGEKLTERQVVAAAGRVSSQTGATLDSFVLAPHWDQVPYYVLHVEPDPAANHDDLAQQMDTALAAQNLEYASKRETGRLASVVVNPLPAGTLADRDRQLAQTRGRTEQFKHQYLLTRPGDAAELLRGSSAHT